MLTVAPPAPSTTESGPAPDLIQDGPIAQTDIITDSPAVAEPTAVNIMKDNDGVAPALPCTPMGTPMNTPTEAEENNNAKKTQGDSPVIKLVMETAARFVESEEAGSQQPLDAIHEENSEVTAEDEQQNAEEAAPQQKVSDHFNMNVHVH